MSKPRRFPSLFRSLATLAAVLMFAVAPAFSQANRAVRLDMARIAKEVQSRGFADYIPVAYRTMGFDSDRVGPADNHARAHFLLYMARDCSHFVLKWEIPALVALAQDPSPPREMPLVWSE